MASRRRDRQRGLRPIVRTESSSLSCCRFDVCTEGLSTRRSRSRPAPGGTAFLFRWMGQFLHQGRKMPAPRRDDEHQSRPLLARPNCCARYVAGLMFVSRAYDTGTGEGRRTSIAANVVRDNCPARCVAGSIVMPRVYDTGLGDGGEHLSRPRGRRGAVRPAWLSTPSLPGLPSRPPAGRTLFAVRH